jgi:Flp pilus assembly protein TadB
MNQSQLRIGDAEREAAARELGEHYAQGRISTEEHAERLDVVWAARTAGDLAPAFAELPRPRPEPVASPRTPRARGWADGVRDALTPVPFLFKVLLAIVVVSLVVGHLSLVVVAVLFYALCLRRLSRRRYHSSRWR